MEAQQQPIAHGKRSGAARRKLKKEKQALLDAQFAGLEIDPEKGWKLPPELVYHIFDLGSAYPFKQVGLRGPAAKESRALFRAAALVCSVWREEAQKLLWDVVHLGSIKAAKSFWSSASKQRTTSTLGMRTPCAGTCEDGEHKGGFDGALVERVLESCAGLRIVTLGHARDLAEEAFNKPQLAGLKELGLDISVTFALKKKLPPAQLSLPFKLTSFYFRNPWQPHDFPYSLVAAAFDSTPVSAQITITTPRGSPPAHTRLPSSVFFPFTPSTKSLQRFDLDLELEELEEAAFLQLLLPLLRQCHALGFLQCPARSEIFAAVPTQLAVVRIATRRPTTYDYHQELDLLRENHFSLSDLAQLEVTTHGSAGVRARRGEKGRPNSTTL